MHTYNPWLDLIPTTRTKYKPVKWVAINYQEVEDQPSKGLDVISRSPNKAYSRTMEARAGSKTDILDKKVY